MDFCRRSIVLIDKSLAGELSEVERRWLEAHVASCARCQAEMVFQRGLHDALVHHELPQLGEDFALKIVERIELLRNLRRRRVLVRFIGASALISSVIVIAWLAVMSGFWANLMRTIGSLGAIITNWSLRLSGLIYEPSRLIAAHRVFYLVGVNCLAAALVLWALRKLSPVLRRS